MLLELLSDLQQKLGMQVSVFTGLYPLLGADEVSGKVVIVKSLSYMLILMVLQSLPFDKQIMQYNLESGTSMSCPHTGRH